MTAAAATRITHDEPDADFSPAVQTGGGMMDIATTRAAQEVQAAMVVAKRFPRDANASYAKIVQACKRKKLADQALYAYPRGGQVVTGPSIRLAEELARSWGNIDFGIIELEQLNGESTCMSYAWDLETNTRQTKIFTVKHERHTRSGVTKLKDPRDIYELTANQGARRLRACILGIIPGDVTEDAVIQCERTMAGDNKEPLADRIRKMVAAFADVGVTADMIEKRLAHNLDATSEPELVNLRKIFRSLNDNMASVGDFFDTPKGASEKTADLNSKINGAAPDPTDEGPAESVADEQPEQAPDENVVPHYQVLIDMLAGKCDCANDKAEKRLADYAKKVLGVKLADLTDKQITDTKAKIADGSLKV